MAAFRSTTGANSGSGAGVGYPGLPAGATSGDVLLWAISATAQSGVNPPTADGASEPSGWTKVVDLTVSKTRLLIYSLNYTGQANPGSLFFTNTVHYSTTTIAYSATTSVGTPNTNTGATGNGSVSGIAANRGVGLEVTVYANEAAVASTPPTGETERVDISTSTAGSLEVNDESATTGAGTKTNTFATATTPWLAASIPLDVGGVNVGATLSGVTFPLRHAGLGPYQSSGGNYYFFGRDSVNTGQVEPHKASDPMSAFTAQTLKTMSSATTTAIEAMACYQVGQVIHVATQIATGVVYYNSYTMDTDTWSLTTSETPQAAAATTFAPVAGNTWVTLGVRSGGNVVFFYSGGVTVMSGTLNSVYYRERTGVNTYGTATAVATGTNNYTGGPIVMGASDRVHLHYKDHTNSDAYHRTLSAANALSVASAFDATADATLFVWGAGVSYVSGAATKVRAPYGDSGQTTSIVQYDSADTPTITTSTAVSGATVKATNTQLAHILANDSTTVHMLYSDATASDLQHDSNVNDAGWGVDINEFVGTVNAITPGVYTRSGTKRLASVIDNAGSIVYIEIDLAAADPDVQVLSVPQLVSLY